MTSTLAFNELEWRSYAIMADACHAIIGATKESRTFNHYHVLRDLATLNRHLGDLMEFIHTPISIEALEASTPERLIEIADKMSDVHEKITEVIVEARSVKAGFWGKRLYRRFLRKLEMHSRELESHVSAFTKSESLIVLSTRDQDHLIESILNPPEPNAALRRAFARK